MRRFLVVLTVLFLAPHAVAADERAVQIGKTYLFDYGDTAYEITLETETDVHWKLIKGDYPGPQEDLERYYLSEVADGVVLISWVEASGLGLYNVLNLNNGTLITHAREGDITHINKGTITLLP